MKNRNQQIIAFAEKWIAKFQDNNVSCYDLTDGSFGEDSFALKFDMDCGKGFFEKYKIDDFGNVIPLLNAVDDIDYLASVIFSYWRYFNHWAYDASEIDSHREWFIVTLTKLKELASIF